MKIISKKREQILLFASAFCFFCATLTFAEAADTVGTPTTITIPTPDTIPAPNLGTVPGVNQTASPQPTQVLGQFRNQNNTVKLGAWFLKRYKDSVVRVRALDQDGNELGRSMGVSVGKAPEQYIAAPLSLVLGNSQQWADKIEIEHEQGNRYYAKIALVDEDLNLVLLLPEDFPAPIPFVRAGDERPQIEVFTISFGDPIAGSQVLSSDIHKGTLAAANIEQGTLSVSSAELTDAQAGTAIINMQGELVGMLLPNGHGVLSSTIQKLMTRIQGSAAISPSLVGVIMGRGIMVDPNADSATKPSGIYKSIPEAFEALKKGEAPKTDPTRFIPAKTRLLSPVENDKLVVKILPGIYRLGAPLKLPSNISLSGAGPKKTLLLSTIPGAAVLSLPSGAQNIMISNMRLVPAGMQPPEASTINIESASDVTILGNLLEAKGGIGVLATKSKNIDIVANSFPNGKARAIECRESALKVETNAFLGNWDIAVSADKGCSLQVRRNLFLQNRISVASSSLAKRTSIEENSFLKSVAGIKVSGETNSINIDDNIFYDNFYGIFSTSDLAAKNVGRNAAWKSRFTARSRPLKNVDLVRTEPSFENPGAYDFRVKLGQGQLGVALKENGADLGAYQRSDYMGAYTSQYIHSLESATNRDGLAATWGYQE